VAPLALLACVLASLTDVRPLGAAAVAVLVGVAGHGLIGAATGRLPWAARSGIAVGAGVLLAALPLLALADLGWFGPVGVAVVGALLAAAGASGNGRARRVGVLPVVLLALAGAGAASLPAYAFDLGGRDAGFYVMTSEGLRRDGGLVLRLDPDVRDAMARFAPRRIGADEERPLPGFFVRASDDRGATELVPHGYHLVPAAMAGGATVTGGGGQWVVTLLGAVLVLLTAGAAALLVRPGLRAVATLAAGALLAGDAALIYFSRYPMTEVPSGVVLLTAGLAAAAALRGAGPRVAALAGVALGAAPLVRPDAWPLLVAAPVVALLLAGRGARPARAFAAGLVPLVALAALRALTASGGYTDDTIGYVLGGVSPTAVVLALGVFAAAGSVAAALVPPEPVRRLTAPALAGLARPRALRALAGVALVAAVVLVVHPPSLGLSILQEYATRPGVLLAGAGVAGVLLSPAADRRRVPALVPLLLLAVVALALVARSPQVLVPDQYWTARRYLPLALPVGAALGGVAVALAVGLRRRRPWGPGLAALALVLVAGALAGSLSDARPALSTTEFDGVPERVDRIDALITGRDPLVVMGPGYTSWGMLGPALLLRQDRDVVMLGSARDRGRERVATLDDPELSAWLHRVALRRPVYLVTANVPAFSVATNPADVVPRTVGTVGLPVTQIDHRVGGPPTRAETTTDLVAVVRLEPGAGR
jgi:hypothetical protein